MQYYSRIKTMAPRVPVISIIIWKEDASLPAMFNPLNSSTNQQLFKTNFCIVAPMKIMDDFHYK